MIRAARYGYASMQRLPAPFEEIVLTARCNRHDCSLTLVARPETRPKVRIHLSALPFLAFLYICKLPRATPGFVLRNISDSGFSQEENASD